MISDEQLAELERLDREATPGPWRHPSDYGQEVWGPVPGDTFCGSMQIARVGAAYFDLANADFIAAARNALPELVAEVRRLRDARAVLEGVTDCLTRERDEARAAIRHAADVMSCTPDGNDDFVEAVSLLVQERDEARAALAQARREGAEEMRERAAQAFDAEDEPYRREVQAMLRALPLPGEEP